MTPSSRSINFLRSLLVVAVLVASTLGAATTDAVAQPIGQIEDPSGPPSNRCERLPNGQRVRSDSGEPASLKKPPLDNADGIVFEFGRSRDTLTRGWEVPLTNRLHGAGQAQVQLITVGFDNLRIDQSVVVQAFVLDAEDAIYVRFCWDPSQPSQTPAGEYRGTVRINDPAFQSMETQIVIRLQDRDLALPVLAVATSAVSGTFWQWATVAGWRSRRQGKRRTRFNLTAGQLEFAAAVLAGVGVALWSVLLGDYSDNPSWTGDAPTYKGIITASFAASTGAYGVAALFLKRMIPEAARPSEPVEADAPDALADASLPA